MGLVRVLARAGSYLDRIFIPTPSESQPRCDSGPLAERTTEWPVGDVWVLAPGEWLCVLVSDSDGHPPVGQFLEG